MKTKNSLFEVLMAPAISLNLFSRWLGVYMTLDQEIPDIDVPEEVRQQLGGYLFPEGTGIVDQLILSMNKHPDAFTDYPDVAELEAGQVRAQGWLTLHRWFSGLADRIQGLHMLERAATTRMALDILRDVDARAARPYATPADRDRKEAAIRPLLLLHAWHRRKTGVRRG